MDRDQKLARVLVEFAHTLGTDFSIQGTLDLLVLNIVDVLPVSGAGVMLMGGEEQLHFVAASNAMVLEIESLQNELGEGPCLEAYRTDEAVAVPDLGRDTGSLSSRHGRRTKGLPRSSRSPCAWTSTVSVPWTSIAIRPAPSTPRICVPHRYSQMWRRRTCSTPRRAATRSPTPRWRTTAVCTTR